MCFIPSQAAAVGVPRVGGGPEQLVLFLVLRSEGVGGSGSQQHRDLLSQCQAAIRAKLSPLFRVTDVRVRASLTRNASNKVMRRVCRDEVLAAWSKPSAKL